MNLKECVIIDGMRSANGRAHAEKGWFRNVEPVDMLVGVYDALFARNPKVKPEMVEATYIGTAKQVNSTYDIGRLAWLAGGYPETVAANTICQQCPSGMSAIEHAARAIMCGEGDIYIAGGCENMLIPMKEGVTYAKSLTDRYDRVAISMGATAEKVAELYNVDPQEMRDLAIASNQRAAAARDAGKFKNEIAPIMGHDVDGTPMLVDKDQWIRDDISNEGMLKMKSPFKENGVITAAMSSPLTMGACAVILMSREKADELGLDYFLKYAGGAMAGNDPTVMGLGPIPAVKKLLARTGVKANEIGAVEINEAFASQSLVCVKELGLETGLPFKKTNMWGGALALGHPLGESGARIVITLMNVMKSELKDAKYGLAALCGGFGNANATLWERIK
jgi:acetyl-CoA acyltransferase